MIRGSRWFRVTVESIPIPKLAEEEERPFIVLVARILSAKVANPDANTSELEAQIDWLVYDLYGLMVVEREAVGEG